jgi:hypothetical protein
MTPAIRNSKPNERRRIAGSRVYNAALAASDADRRILLLERFAQVGAGAVVRPPFRCDYGFNISLGAGLFCELQLRDSAFTLKPPLPGRNCRRVGGGSPHLSNPPSL